MAITDTGLRLIAALAMMDHDIGRIVMGGYGHTQLREMFLGGVTRTQLRHKTVPVLILH